MKKKIFLILIGGLLGILFLAGCQSELSQYDDFAACLTEKGVKMYGTDWCPACKKQKGLFGSSFSKVDYVNCDFKSVECREAGVEGYPTWKLPNGEKAVGVQAMRILEEKTDCPLFPEETSL